MTTRRRGSSSKSACVSFAWRRRETRGSIRACIPPCVARARRASTRKTFRVRCVQRRSSKWSLETLIALGHSIRRLAETRSQPRRRSNASCVTVSSASWRRDRMVTRKTRRRRRKTRRRSSRRRRQKHRQLRTKAWCSSSGRLSVLLRSQRRQQHRSRWKKGRPLRRLRERRRPLQRQRRWLRRLRVRKRRLRQPRGRRRLR